MLPEQPHRRGADKGAACRYRRLCAQNGTLLLYDSAYEAYIREPDAPHSIFEIDGAQRCAIEFRSMSKTAGFTGVRCAYTVVPKALRFRDTLGNEVSLNAMWGRRMTTKFNGVSYITQRGAAAGLSDEGHAQLCAVVADYMENARIIRESLRAAGYTVYGGVNAPYIWLKVPHGDSWRFSTSCWSGTTSSPRRARALGARARDTCA